MFGITKSRKLSPFALIGNWQWEQVFDQTVHHMLWGMIVLAPLFWGGRGEIARLVYAILSAALVTIWLVRQWLSGRSEWNWSPVFWLPLLAVAWMVLQLIPMPSAVIEWFAPRTTELLPLWQDQAWLEQYGLTGWSTLSLDPVSGQVSMAMMLSCSLTMVVVFSRMRNETFANQIVLWIAQSGTFMAVFGLLQHLTAGGLFFWVYKYPFRVSDDYVCGSFINHNHFASFLVMSAGAIVYQLMMAVPASMKSLPVHGRHQSFTFDKATLTVVGWAASLAVTVLALIMSASRGAMLAAVAATLVLLAVYLKKRLIGVVPLVTTIIVAAVVVIGMSLQVDERFTDRLGDLTSGSIDAVDHDGARRAIWNANLQAISHGWLVGAGAGSHAMVYPAYLDRTHTKVFTHAENGYLQVATELGLPGIALLIAMGVTTVRWAIAAWKNCTTREQSALLGAVLAGIAASAVHSLTDFVWYIPATFTLLILLMAVLRYLAKGQDDHRKADTSTSRPSPDLALVAMCSIIVMGVILIRPALASSAMGAYLAASEADSWRQPLTLRDAAETGDLGKLEADESILVRKIEALRKVVSLDPSDSGAHMRLSRAYLQWFDLRAPVRENRMSLGHIQLAVADGGFTSPEQIESWLERAIGPDVAFLEAAEKHALRSLQLCPLQEMSYVCLASVAFLHDRPVEPLLAQADKLAPQDGNLLFEIGKRHMAVNNLEQAIEYWVRSCEHPGQHRFMVVASMAGNIPVNHYLTTFAPDWQTLRLVWKRYRDTADPESLAELLEYAEQRADEYDPASANVQEPYIWIWLAAMYKDVGNESHQIACLERAMDLNPTLVPVRKSYAVALLEAGKFNECESHFRWCLARDSTDRSLRQYLHKATSGKRRQEVVPSTATRVRSNRYQ
ncbi:O-antigen ligase family protein [Aeoliella mucimassa]|uniref:O-Antigen ligase n=1 Tax=Aeoliella mucimassa TaxID=2527972 RepID=A0A518AKZ3_9BACT|nr:O-antigen ligase family protein [Aeoliella mucimassa]QDU55354.1 O-Antigen ligase [Aeoliella mucimassa]